MVVSPDRAGLDSGRPPEKWFPFLGLVVMRRTDLLAAAAFIMSLSAILYQFWQFALGARPAIFHPDTVYVFFDRYANGVVATRLAGQVSFTNRGEAGHSAIIRDVNATMTTNKRSIEETWLSFVTVTRKEIALQIDVKEGAHPVVVAGGNALSYMATFAPRVNDCPAKQPVGAQCNQANDFVSDIEFLNLLSPGALLDFKFEAKILDSKESIESRCSAPVTDDLIINLAKNSWYATRCVSER